MALLSFEFGRLTCHLPPLGHSEPRLSLGQRLTHKALFINASEQVTELVGEEITLLLPGIYGMVGGGLPGWASGLQASQLSSWGQELLRTSELD